MRALAEPSRLKIVRQLLDGPHAVGELCQTLELTPYNASRHLAVLKTAGLVEMEKHAQQRIYSLAAAFREKISSNTLDLGCCQFDFKKLPK
jgi:DNA-binding transcriptional ArsR family regulator